jgi:hypothetical protein
MDRLGHTYRPPASPTRGQRGARNALIRISITPAAFDAIAATLPLGSVGFGPEVDAKGERAVWVETSVVDKLSALRGPGESYSDVILRLAAG